MATAAATITMAKGIQYCTCAKDAESLNEHTLSLDSQMKAPLFFALYTTKSAVG
jgi:hypothetical protein